MRKGQHQLINNETQFILTQWCNDKPCIITIFPLQLSEEEPKMWTRFTERLINESSSQHFLKNVYDIKNGAINRRAMLINKTLRDVYPLILGTPFTKFENKINK
jgi:hypothetical protein